MNNFRRRTLLSSSGDGRKMIGNYEAVDLGLPSGVLWATCNVGATEETEVGNYYQWGSGTEVYTYPETNYHHVPIENFTHRGGNKYLLPSSADTATQVMGDGWRTPFGEDFELKNYIQLSETFTNNSGVVCGKFVSKINPDAYIIIPFGGDMYNGAIEQQSGQAYFWLSNARYANRPAPYGDQSDYFTLTSSGAFFSKWALCYQGLNIRAVHDPI